MGHAMDTSLTPTIAPLAIRPGTVNRLALIIVAGIVIASGLSGCSGLTSASSPNPKPAVGALSANPSSVGFGSVPVGSSASQSFTLTNSGSVSVIVSQVSVSNGSFSIVGLSLPTTIAVSQSVTIQLQFAPQAAGSATGTASVTSNTSNSPISVSLTGTGIQPQISSTPSTVSFGSVAIGSNSTQTISLNNPGTANLTISQASVSGTGFSMTGLSVPITITPGTSKTFSAEFAPNSTGSASGSISLTSNAPTSPTTIPLSGTGATATFVLTAAPTSLSFGNVAVGSTSSQNATLTNTGNSSVTISQVTVSGSGYSVSGVASNTTLTAGQSVTLTVSLTPTSTGNATGSVTITSNASNSPTTITLTGGSHLVDLSWTASTSVVVGYNVYRGTTNSGPYTLKLNPSLVSGVTFTDTNVQSGQTYYYVVTAVDSNGVESVYSNQASATIP